MAEPNPVTASPPSEPDVYRPVSLLAVAGLCLSGLYGALVVITALVALFQGAPFFLPQWTILFALAGGVVSFLGVRQIANSEGTRAGAALARWGLWLAVVLGPAYLAYHYFTGLALKQQANSFLLAKNDDDSGFFPRLIDGSSEEINRAFLLTKTYSERLGRDPKNHERMNRDFDAAGPMGEGGELSNFREHPLVRGLSGKKEATVEPLGVQEWKYDSAGRTYQVVRNYKVHTPAMSIDVQVKVASTEGDDSEGRRKWFVVFREMRPGPPQWTKLGEALREARHRSRSAMERLVKSPQAKDFEALQDDTAYERVFPRDFPVEALKRKMVSILEGTSPEVQRQIIPMEEAPLVWDTLPGDRLRLAHDANLQVEAVRDIAGFKPFKARMRFWVETVGAYDPLAATEPPTWRPQSFEITSVSGAAYGPPTLQKQ
jgi:hypothetical protein